jgi:hypothetical protein
MVYWILIYHYGRPYGTNMTRKRLHDRGGPGFVAAVCVRDHWDEMEPEEHDWCVNMLIGRLIGTVTVIMSSFKPPALALIHLDRQHTYCPRSCMKVYLAHLMNE